MILVNESLESPNISHGFFTRKGGVSTGIYESLNCGYGSDDSPDNVTENRKKAANQLGSSHENLCTLYQIHSNKVVHVTSPWEYKDSPEADGMVTDIPGIILGVQSADCCPVLFADKEKKIIGAAHAGWKGALSGILENTIEEMRKLGAENITAAIGPTIGKDSYEVGAEFRDEFIAKDGAHEKFFENTGDKFLFDLPSFVTEILKKSGVENISNSKIDTLTDEENFFSYRRTTKRKEADYGRQLSAIMIKP